MSIVNKQGIFSVSLLSIFLLGCGGGGGGSTKSPSVSPEPAKFSTTIKVSGSGTVTANQQSYLNGETATFTVTPNEGHILTSLTGCGVTLDYDHEFSPSSFTIDSSPFEKSCELSATFTERVKLADIFVSNELRACAINNNFTEGENDKVYADEVVIVSCYDKDITDTSGIEHLVKLEVLRLDRTGILQLNVTNNKRLLNLSVRENQLTQLDVSKNPWLTKIDADFNDIGELDISNNQHLNYLYLYSNQLSSIDLSQNSKLIQLNIGANREIKAIDLSQQSDLESLNVSVMLLTELDLSHNPLLEDLNAEFNQLSRIDLSNNLAIDTLTIGGNPAMTDLDVSMLTHLEQLMISSNITNIGNISHLDLSQNLKLWRIWAEHQSIQQLDLSHNTELRELDMRNNQLSSIDLTFLPKLRWLDLRINSLTTLDLTANTQLTDVWYDNDVVCVGSKC